MIRLPSPNHGPRPEGVPVDMLVLHYTGMATAALALERLRDAAAQVSAHYMIDEDGTLYALVDESRRAWHAGVALWRGHGDVNGRSIGIELVNPGLEFGYRPFPEPQLATLEALCRDLLTRHPIPARNVVGHSDVAPRRKVDPGELFPWHRLAQAGIGLWPNATPEARGPFDRAEIMARLACHGYDISDEKAAVVAFQRHFRPENTDGHLDAQTSALARTLTTWNST